MQIESIFGCTSTHPKGAFKTADDFKQLFAILQREGVTKLDTARLYVGSEETLGSQPGHEAFTFDTKILGGFAPGSAAPDAILRDTQDSLSKCQVPQFDVLYLHAPDSSVAIEDTLAGIDAAHKKGWFRRFGLSNFTAQQVQQCYDVAKERGYVLPTVYQGNYSPIARHLETLLFPTLRKLGIAFYAYSPLAGGFLTKTLDDLEAGKGRFNPQVIGGMYNNMYNKPRLREALGEWNIIAEAEGVSKAELAYRWVGYNSALKAELGDAVLFGASSLGQVEQTAKALKKGGLSEESVRRIEAMWQSVKDDAPVDNFGANKL